MNRYVLFLLDILYPVLKKIIPFETYRYLAVGGVCFFINFTVFHFSYFFIFTEKIFILHFISPHFAALLSAMTITLPIGFYLTKKTVFTHSTLKNYTQFLSYSVSTIAIVYCSKILLDFLILSLQWKVTWAYLSTTFLVQYFNFFFQKNISFQKK